MTSHKSHLPQLNENSVIPSVMVSAAAIKTGRFKDTLFGQSYPGGFLLTGMTGKVTRGFNAGK